MTDATAARRAALRILEEVDRGATFDAARERHVAILDNPDCRLAHELAAGVLRSRSTLDWQLKPLVRSRWSRIPITLKEILRLGAYQLDRLDRVPSYAAVSTSVELARETSGTRSARFVNAVLRRFADANRSEPGVAVDPVARLAREGAHPAWLVARWYRRFGESDTRALLEWNNTRPPLVLQPIVESSESLLSFLSEAGARVKLAPHGAGVVVERMRPNQIPGYREGRWVVQDPAAGLVLRFANIPQGVLVYDACAAPGGKAVHLARGRALVAGDRNRDRVALLRDTLDRTRSGARVIVADACLPPVGKIDAVVLDAPCTATGTLRRRPDARHRITPHGLTRMAGRQEALLDALAGVVRVDGLLVYATCSLEPEENELQVHRFLERHPEFQRSDDTGPVPPGVLTVEGELALLPQRDQTDGAFAARLRRVR